MSFDPIRSPEDDVYISNKLVPGIVVITGLKAERSWDERQEYGTFGCRLRYKGQRLSHFSLIVGLYTQEHWDDWQEFEPIVRRPPPPDRSLFSTITSIPSLYRVMQSQSPPLSIRHPLLDQYRINRVVIEGDVAPVQNEQGVWTAEIKLIQYRQPVRVLSSSGGRPREEGTSAQDREIAALTSQLNQLANRGNR